MERELLFVWLTALTIAVGYCLLRLKAQQNETDNDCRYFEWWLRSLEERKAAKDDYEYDDVEDDL